MKRSLAVVLFVLAVAVAAMAPGAAAAEPENSVNLGIGGGQLMPHCRALVSILEYERMLGSKFSVLGRASGVHYRFDDGDYREEGRPRGLDVGARFYPSGGMQGLFIGGTVGSWTADWAFTRHEGRPDESQGTGKSDSIRANIDLGGRFPIGSSSLSIMPQLDFGRFFPSTTCSYTAPASQVGTACSQDSEVKYYVFIAVTAGIAF